MQLVQWKCHLEEGYINTWQNIIFCVHAFYHVLLGCFSLYALILLWQKTAVNFHAAHKKTDLRAAHEALLTCFLLLCITWIITRVQCTKNSSRAVHENCLACSLFCVTRVFRFKSQQKLKNTHVFTTHDCQLRYELYRNIICMSWYYDSVLALVNQYFI